MCFGRKLINARNPPGQTFNLSYWFWLPEIEQTKMYAKPNYLRSFRADVTTSSAMADAARKLSKGHAALYLGTRYAEPENRSLNFVGKPRSRVDRPYVPKPFATASGSATSRRAWYAY